MKRFIFITLALIAMTSCNNTKTNPFLTEWDTPYGIPPFEEITIDDYMPAIEAGIEQNRAEVDAIINNPDAPTFENTIAALDLSGEILAKVLGVLYNLTETDGTDELNAVLEASIPMTETLSSDIYMNADLFAKVKAVYENQDGLDREQQMLLEKTYKAFVKNGVGLDAEGQSKMRDINIQLSTLEQKFGNNILAENNSFKEKFDVTISDYPDFMGACSDRNLREEMFKAYSNRCANGNEYDNTENVIKILDLRQQKANLLGYATPADMILEDKMAKTPKTVDDFLMSIFTPAVSRAKEEVADMQKEMDKDIAEGLVPEGSTIQPWDWFYYAERVRKAKFDLDEEQTKPYFQMENVRAGVFATACKLYGLSIEPVADAPKYFEEVEVFKVTDIETGKLLGILTTDYFPRSTKRGGAWMNNIRDQYFDAEGNEVRPIIVNVGNFAKPTEDAPSLLTIDQVGTMFHEFGHALHGLLTQCHYKGVSGTSVARDFVELPSQINENWAFQKEVLATYAKHYQTGEVIPDELVAKIQAASTFNMGFMTTELAAASILDMKWHELSSVEGINVDEFEAKVCKEMGLIDEIIPRYRSKYFNHIFNSGYSAGYYSYLWAEVLDKDAFELFKQNGILDPVTAASFKHNILEKGSSEEPMVLYHNFRGADPDPDALLKARGLK